MINKIFQHFKNHVKTSRLFWKFRHLIHSEVWSDYYESHSTSRRNFYSQFTEKNGCETIFEFGTASGPNLKNIDLFCTKQTYCLGFDINAKAIKTAKANFKSQYSFFSTTISKQLLTRKLAGWGYDVFDLAIYDRVLYLLSESEVNKHFSEYYEILDTIVIDDFHNSKFEDSNDSYHSKNYEKILLKFGYKLICNEKSEHIVIDQFFDRCARRLIFRKR